MLLLPLAAHEGRIHPLEHDKCFSVSLRIRLLGRSGGSFVEEQASAKRGRNFKNVLRIGIFVFGVLVRAELVDEPGRVVSRYWRGNSCAEECSN